MSSFSSQHTIESVWVRVCGGYKHCDKNHEKFGNKARKDAGNKLLVTENFWGNFAIGTVHIKQSKSDQRTVSTCTYKILFLLIWYLLNI